MKRLVLVAIVLGALFSEAPARAQSASDVTSRVERALLRIEGEAPASFYASLGTEGRDALLAIVRDAQRARGLRRRATLALAHYPEAVVRDELERRASTDDDALVSRYALRALGVAFGASAFDTIARALDDARPFVREGAAITLAELDLVRARPILAARLAVEPELFVRSELERRLQGRGPR